MVKMVSRKSFSRSPEEVTHRNDNVSSLSGKRTSIQKGVQSKKFISIQN